MSELLLSMIVLHALFDYPLQGDFLARAKNHVSPLPGVPWYQALGAHAAMQGGAVTFLTGSVLLGFAEAAAHSVIDYGKNAGWFGFNVDQALHVACKALWVALIYSEVAP